MSKQIRLDRFLADAGLGTRSEVKKYIRQGRVKVHGETARVPEQATDGSGVMFDDVPVLGAPEFVYYLLNKPAGWVCATRDEREKTVLELLPPQPRRNLFPVGRLDKDTEGLLLITDDGRLAHALLAPGRHVDKVYEALVRGSLGEEAVRAFAEGMDIGDDKRTLPAELEIIETQNESGQAYTLVRVTLREGRYHQVKRMVKAAGGEVVALRRLAMGRLTLPDDLLPGQWREITAAQILCDEIAVKD